MTTVEPEATYAPSGENATDMISDDPMPDSGSKVTMGVPVASSLNNILPSKCPVIRNFPSGEKATDVQKRTLNGQVTKVLRRAHVLESQSHTCP